MIRKVVGLHFSPLGGTAVITEKIVNELAAALQGASVEEITCECYDMIECLNEQPAFDEETIVVLGAPVCVGKIPLPVIHLLENLKGRGAMTVALVSYGTNTYGNALYELYNYAEENGFVVIGAGAFVAKHPGKFIRNSRPDADDLKAMVDFCKAASGKLRRLAGSEIEGLRITPAPLLLAGRMPVHRVSRISPRAAAIAQLTLERATLKRAEAEWFL